jgi:hypothetical protein
MLEASTPRPASSVTITRPEVIQRGRRTGEIVRKYREEVGLTRREFSLLIGHGMTTNYITRIECGHVRVGRRIATRIHDATGLPIEALLGRNMSEGMSRHPKETVIPLTITTGPAGSVSGVEAKETTSGPVEPSDDVLDAHATSPVDPGPISAPMAPIADLDRLGIRPIAIRMDVDLIRMASTVAMIRGITVDDYISATIHATVRRDLGKLCVELLESDRKTD